VSLYLDASVIIPIVVDERFTEIVGAFLLGCGDNLTASDFAAAEVASALSQLVRMGVLEIAKRSRDWQTSTSGEPARPTLPRWTRTTAGWPTPTLAASI
jgi:predicted nucleic acid-binding protein